VKKYLIAGTPFRARSPKRIMKINTSWFENDLDWAISSEAPVKWRTFIDYPYEEYARSLAEIVFIPLLQ